MFTRIKNWLVVTLAFLSMILVGVLSHLLNKNKFKASTEEISKAQTEAQKAINEERLTNHEELKKIADISGPADRDEHLQAWLSKGIEK